jgi:hypothetical protein
MYGLSLKLLNVGLHTVCSVSSYVDFRLQNLILKLGLVFSLLEYYLATELAQFTGKVRHAKKLTLKNMLKHSELDFIHFENLVSQTCLSRS